MNSAGQTICLCMIVKNEAHVIRRCLESVKPVLDAWCIVDTGSTDGTQGLIRMTMATLPGEIFERPWVDFAHNRTESLQLAHGRADYLLIIDADEYLEFDDGFRMPRLEADAYAFAMRTGPLAYWKTQLVRDGLPWRYVGVVHEYITADGAGPEARLPGVTTMRITDGARSRDPLTSRKDALLLEGALLQEPENARHMFYLAQSYADAGERDLAIDRFRKRAAMGGWAEEAWYSQYQIARQLQANGEEWPVVLDACLNAYAARPSRAEPFFLIGFHYSKQGQFALAYLFLKQAIGIPYPEADVLFVEKSVYDWMIPLEFSVACFYVGHHDEAIETSNRLLSRTDLTTEQVEQITRNRQFSLDALEQREIEPKPAKAKGRVRQPSRQADSKVK